MENIETIMYCAIRRDTTKVMPRYMDFFHSQFGVAMHGNKIEDIIKVNVKETEEGDSIYYAWWEYKEKQLS